MVEGNSCRLSSDPPHRHTLCIHTQQINKIKKSKKETHISNWILSATLHEWLLRKKEKRAGEMFQWLSL